MRCTLPLLLVVRGRTGWLLYQRKQDICPHFFRKLTLLSRPRAFTFCVAHSTKDSKTENGGGDGGGKQVQSAVPGSCGLRTLFPFLGNLGRFLIYACPYCYRRLVLVSFVLL